MTQETNSLPNGFQMQEYRIDSVLGTGGFGVTYKAQDIHLESWVAIKEYFPTEWAYRGRDGIGVHANGQGQIIIPEVKTSGYDWGLDRFLDEARVLARVQHPYVVRVRRYFRAHGTAYIVMDYEEGEPLSALLKRETTLAETDLRGLLEEVLPALDAVHRQGFLHRDLKPSNLYVRARDGCVMLIDFGAARQSLGQRSKSITGLVTPGYSPPEQYITRNDRYGPWTDLYALGAVLYRCITGKAPIEAPDRQMWDTLVPAAEAGAGRYHPGLLAVIDKALAMRPEDRFQSVAEMVATLAKSISLTIALPPRAAAPAEDTTGLLPDIDLSLLSDLPSSEPAAAPAPQQTPAPDLDPLSSFTSEPLALSLQSEPGRAREAKPAGASDAKSLSSALQAPALTPPAAVQDRSQPVSGAMPRPPAAAYRPQPGPPAGELLGRLPEPAEVALSTGESEFPGLPARLSKRQRDLLLLGVLVVLLGMLAGLMLDIYQGYQERTVELRRKQQEETAQNTLRDALERDRRRREEAANTEVSQLISQVRAALDGADLVRAAAALNRAQELAQDDPRVVVLGRELRAAQQRAMPPIETWVEPRIQMRMVRIKADCFEMGSPDNQPERYINELQHRICVGDFWISEHELTNGQYRLFKPEHHSGAYRGKTLNDDRQPVVEVTWNDAVAYARWLSEQTGKRYRLPTEAEWEYAARGLTLTPRYWGFEVPRSCQYANVADKAAQAAWGAIQIHDCSDGQPVAASVGAYTPNAFKLHDMLGNVSEWTCSEFQSRYNGEELRCSTQEPHSGRRSVRGGSWDDAPNLVRAADRNGREPDVRDNDLGFRLVQEE